MKTLTLEGKIATGEGNGKKYLQLPWVKQQLEEKLGFTPFLGTLNLELSRQSVKRKRKLPKAKTIMICPPKGYCVGLFFKASIGGLECVVVLPQIEGYAEDLLEVIAPVNLREALKLGDGDTAKVKVYI